MNLRIPVFTANLVIAALGAATAAARAAALTFYFEGNINFVNDSLDLDDSVFVGAPFSGTYTFDPAGVHDVLPGDPEVGQYVFGSAGQMEARIGNYDFVSHDLWMLIWNDSLSGDLYEPISTTPFEAAGMQWSGMSVVLGDRAGAALDSDALPLGVPDLSDFPDFAGLVLHLANEDVGIKGVLISLTPEPNSIMVLVVGTMLIRWRRNR